MPALASLTLFAWLLTQVDVGAASLAWLWVVEGVRPTRPDLTGVPLCLIGTAVILLGR